MTDKLVSVVIPCFNASKFITTCLDSIVEQTYKNIEIIILDDASTDDTVDIIKDYISSKKNNIPIKLILFKDNKGPARARNLGVKNSLGYYIAFMDADDISTKNRIELQMNLLKSENTDICVSPLQNFGKNKRHISYIGKTQNELIKICLLKCPFPQPSVFGKRNVFLSYKYNEKIKAEDYDLWSTLLFNSKFSILEKPIIYGRNHDNSLSSFHANLIAHQTHAIRLKALEHFGVKLSPQDKSILYISFNGIINNFNQLVHFESLILKILSSGIKNKFIENVYKEQLYWVLRKNIQLRMKLFYLRFLFHKPFCFFGFKKELKLLASIIFETMKDL